MTYPILIARNLSRYYRVARGLFKPVSLIKALHGVSFELSVGETLGVVGESGCGKSTLARQLTMVEVPTSGELELDGLNMLSPATAKRLRSRVQMVFQHPYASLNPRKSIRSVLNEPLLLNTDFSRQEREERIQTTLARVGLHPDHLQRYPHMFSGGQCQRIAIARAMILHPRLIVADEPTSLLDVSVQAQILNLFMDLQEQFETSYVFVSHNLPVVRYIANQIMVMYFGSVVEYGACKAIYTLPLHPYTRALMSATPTIRTTNRVSKVKLLGEPPSPFDPPSGCAFHTRCPYAVARCKMEIPELRSIDHRLVACHRVEEIK